VTAPRMPRGIAGHLVRRLDPDGARHAAERRVGRPLHAAVPLRPRGPVVAPQPWSTPESLLVALGDDDVFVLQLRALRPLALTVGGVLARLPRAGLVAHWRPRLLVIRAELSWPDEHVFLRGDVPRDPRTDRLIGLLTVSELERGLG
jgi:hypothetical protein